jgi:hypothetical protein
VEGRWRRGRLRYFRAWIGAPQSKDMNASHGRLSELKPIIRNESRHILIRYKVISDGSLCLELPMVYGV